jgi:ketosteroid isomerase-like protein
MRKTLITTLVTIAILVLSILPAGSALAQTGGGQPQDPEAVVTAFVTALNAGDVDAAMALIADPATVTFKVGEVFGAPDEVFSTRSDIQTQFVETSPSNMQVVSLQTSGNTVIAELSSDADEEILAMGIEKLGFIFTSNVANGQIQSAIIELTDETKLAIQTRQSGVGVGMPTTGGTDQTVLLLSLALAAVVVTGTGVLISRASARI